MATTTVDAIRDRIIAVATALVPSSLAADRFAPYRNEGDGDFVTWAASNADAAWRRFQVRDTGDDAPPVVSNTDVEENLVTFTIYVAYPQTSRAGAKNALDRDTVMKQDQHQLEKAVGLYGGANFSGSFPDASWRSGKTARRVIQGVDILVITQTMGFYRAV